MFVSFCHLAYQTDPGLKEEQTNEMHKLIFH